MAKNLGVHSEARLGSPVLEYSSVEKATQFCAFSHIAFEKHAVWKVRNHSSSPWSESIRDI